MKFSIKNYWKPTPKLARQIGDALLYGGQAGAGILAFNNHLTLAGAVWVSSLLGKFLTNWAKDHGEPSQS